MRTTQADHGNERPAGQGTRRLVLVSGPGRTGTSTFAGSLAKLGYVVPPPVLRPNAANPRGYFEPRWVIGFHNRILTRSSTHAMDSRPWAADLIHQAIEAEPFQDELTSWLDKAFESASQLVIKDPRAFWARELWTEASKAVGAKASVVTMLRHPAEVLGSRDTHYDADRPAKARAVQLTRNLFGWINSSLINELTSRNQRRAFLQYEDLIGDWRSALASVDRALDLGLPSEQLDGREHAIDSFIDPTLHRVKVTWDGLLLPDYVRELAQEVWDVFSRDHDNLNLGPDRYEEFDTLRATYRRRFDDAIALGTDVINTRVPGRWNGSKAG